MFGLERLRFYTFYNY